MPDKKEIHREDDIDANEEKWRNGTATGKFIRAQVRSFVFLKPYFTDTFPDI